MTSFIGFEEVATLHTAGETLETSVPIPAGVAAGDVLLAMSSEVCFDITGWTRLDGATDEGTVWWRLADGIETDVLFSNSSLGVVPMFATLAVMASIWAWTDIDSVTWLTGAGNATTASTFSGSHLTGQTTDTAIYYCRQNRDSSTDAPTWDGALTQLDVVDDVINPDGVYNGVHACAVGSITAGDLPATTNTVNTSGLLEVNWRRAVVLSTATGPDDCGRVLWYKMDETAGTTAADSVDARDATIMHDVRLDDPSPPQGNGSFFYRPSTTQGWLFTALDGDAVDITPTTGAHTVAIWASAVSGITINACLFTKDAGTHRVMMQCNNQNLRYYPTQSNSHYCTWTNGKTVLEDGDMHLIVGTWDPDAPGTTWGAATMYADGAIVDVITPLTDLAGLSDWTDGDLYIGAMPGTHGVFDGTVNWWKGAMGDFQVFDYALSAAEVTLMTATGDPCAEPPAPASTIRDSVYWDELGYVTL